MTLFKTPLQFAVGDIIKDESGTQYSGSSIVSIKTLPNGQTQVGFRNGQLVEFFNGIKHQMQE